MRLRDELASEAGAEHRTEERRADIERQIARSEESLAEVEARREALGERPRWGREAKQAYDLAAWELDEREGMLRDGLAQRETQHGELPEVTHEARAEEAAIRHVLDRREDLAFAAARVSPPDHIVAELKERPAEGAERLAWDRVVRQVESYRQRNGVRDRDSALGPEPKGAVDRNERRRAQEAIRRAQREIGIERVQKIQRTQAMEIEL